ncbi:MAG: flagellar export protein FliJ [Candidatus Kapaibacterium sp.]|nr:flagellar FliJ family protein [Ignavibacteriota bacterium]MCB9221870.1 flagellar FliJ family protein [Ignavibacteria bacterium]
MAKQFKFKLDTVLRLRSDKTEEAKTELQLIIRKRIEKEQLIEEQFVKLENHKATRNKNKKLEEIQAFYYHKEFINQEIKRLQMELDNLLDIESLKRTKYNDALKEEKVLQKLKEKKKSAFLDEIAHKEQLELDEIAIRQFTNKMTNV